MYVTNIKVELIHVNYDPESTEYYTEGISISFLEQKRWERKIIIHKDEYNDSDVIGMKLKDFSLDNISCLRKEIKKEIYKRISNSFLEDADYDDPDISNVTEDISALHTVYREMGYLTHLGYITWFEEIKQKNNNE